MCGIIGIIGKSAAAPHLLDALKRLEYRGYDSAGVATVVNGSIERRRAEGKIVNLEGAAGSAAAAGDDRDRAHALGDAWRAQRDQRAPARDRPAWRWCITGSSRTSRR